MPFQFITQEIKEVILIKPSVFEDIRGFFMETYKKSDFIKNNIKDDFTQDNFSLSKKGVLRGLHYQIKPFEQAKLVRCTKGEILDIVVDIRPNSPTFKQHLKIKLSEQNNYSLYIPKGFAHGFVTLSDTALLNYKTSSEYNPSYQRGIHWADKELNIDWEIDFEPILSQQDSKQPNLKNINIEELK